MASLEFHTHDILNEKEYLTHNATFNFVISRLMEIKSPFYNRSESFNLLNWKRLKTAKFWLNAFPNIRAKKVRSYDRSLRNGARMREINS